MAGLDPASLTYNLGRCLRGREKLVLSAGVSLTKNNVVKCALDLAQRSVYSS